MALGAGLGEAGRDVIRVRRALIVLQVTADTGRTDQVEVVVDVAIGTLTWWNGMATGKRETSCTMVKVRIEPCIHAVASGAVGGEAASNVAGVGG